MPAPRAPLAAAAAVLFSASSLAAGIEEGTVRLTAQRPDAGDPSDDDKKFGGILQIYHNGVWGTICEEEWEEYDTAVVCRQMGLGYEYWYEEAYYFYNDDDYYLVGQFDRVPEEDTGIIWHNGDFYCDGEAESSLLDCGSDSAWGDTVCDKTQDVAVMCHYPDQPNLGSPRFVLDVGFGHGPGFSGTKCVSIRDRVEESFDFSHDRRLTHSFHTFSNSTHAFCTSVYSGGAQQHSSEEPHGFEITHRGQDQVCVTRTDGLGEWYGYLRLLCRYVDLASPLVSYKDKGGCGPRGSDAHADASVCPGGLRVVSSASADGELVPIAVLGGYCPIYEYAEHECVDVVVAAEPACADFSPPGGGSWHDADGARFDCEWYAANSVCDVTKGGFGHTAAEACCSCGGGAAEAHGTLAFRSTGTQAEVQTAALSALTELLGIDEGVLELNVVESDSRTSTTATATTTMMEAPYDAVRLVGGPTAWRGRVEIFHDGVWGTVCDDSWSNNDARVVCRQLGFSGGSARCCAEYGAGRHPIWMDDVGCSGSEASLASCSFDGWGSHDCDHSEDASVECDPTTVTATSTTATETNFTSTLTTATTETVTTDMRLNGALWWQVDYSVSLGFAASLRVVERGGNATATLQLLAGSLNASGQLLDEGSLFAAAPQIPTQTQTTTTTSSTGTTTSTRTSTAAATSIASVTSAAATVAGESSRVSTGMAAGLGAAALAVGLAAGALAARFGRGKVGQGQEDTNKDTLPDEVLGTTTQRSEHVFGV